jgi:cob(I)alamin adenosyltransferase
MDEEIYLRNGIIHVYTGPGKGKTTAALGLGLRAVGAGFKVHLLQFMKGRRYSEIDAVKKIPNFTISQHGRDEFVSKKNPGQIDIDLANDGFKEANKLVNSNNYDMIILDEINVAIDYNLIPIENVLKLIDGKPKNLELVLTGRNAHPEIVKRADIVTEMLEIKHPFQHGALGRKGIDF